jgi:hypothetical protein
VSESEQEHARKNDEILRGRQNFANSSNVPEILSSGLASGRPLLHGIFAAGNTCS